MAAQADGVVSALRDLNARLVGRPVGPSVFLEYAAGHEPAWFVEVAQRLQVSGTIPVRPEQAA